MHKRFGLDCVNPKIITYPIHEIKIKSTTNTSNMTKPPTSTKPNIKVDKPETECDLNKCHLEFGKRWSHCNFDHGLDMEDNIIAKLNNDSTITLIDDFNYEVRNTLRADEICACLCNHTLRSHCLKGQKNKGPKYLPFEEKKSDLKKGFN